MPSANKVILIGNLTRDPQLKFLANQMAVVEFGLAMKRKSKDRDETTFVDCAAFGKSAETLNQYVKKGYPLYVEGRLKFDSWEDRNGGGRRSKLSVVIEGFQFLGGGKGADSNESDGPREGGYGNKPWRGKPPAENPIGNEQEFDPEPIPF